MVGVVDGSDRFSAAGGKMCGMLCGHRCFRTISRPFFTVTATPSGSGKRFLVAKNSVISRELQAVPVSHIAGMSFVNSFYLCW